MKVIMPMEPSSRYRPPQYHQQFQAGLRAFEQGIPCVCAFPCRLAQWLAMQTLYSTTVAGAAPELHVSLRNVRTGFPFHPLGECRQET